MKFRRRLRSFTPAITFVIVGLPAAVSADVASWSQPDIDTWNYVNGSSPGTRTLAPSFGNLGVDNSTNEFLTNNSQDPARLASLLIAFETSSDIEAGLDTNRYQINSATVTARISSGTFGDLLYESQPTTPEDLLAAVNGPGITTQLPFELFGVGFRDGVEGFALGPDQSGTRFAEATAPFSASDSGYVAYPVIGDGAGGYVDVANNVTGGFSATEASGSTAPIATSPWAVGSVAGLDSGDTIPNDSTVTFEVDLTEAGVVEYLQQALSNGGLGFFVSTVHPTAQPGFPGARPYPQWYTKEAVGVFAGAEAPTLSIDYTILEEVFPVGDYDRSGSVGPEDYLSWRSTFGDSVLSPGEGADGNGDQLINAADYVVWRDLTQPASGAAVVAAAIPEPSSSLALLVSISCLLVRRRACVYFSSNQNRA